MPRNVFREPGAAHVGVALGTEARAGAECRPGVRRGNPGDVAVAAELGSARTAASLTPRDPRPGTAPAPASRPALWEPGRVAQVGLPGVRRPRTRQCGTSPAP